MAEVKTASDFLENALHRCSIDNSERQYLNQITSRLPSTIDFLKISSTAEYWPNPLFRYNFYCHAVENLESIVGTTARDLER